MIWLYGAIVIHVVLAIRATRNISKYDEFESRKKMFTIFAWLVPIIGPFWFPAPAKPSASNQQTRGGGFVDATAPQSIEIAEGYAIPHQEAFLWIEGFPYLNWKVIESKSRGHNISPEEIPSQFVIPWLLHFRDALGDSFSLHQSESAVILSSLSPQEITYIDNTVNSARKKILRCLDGVAKFPPNFKSVVVILDDAEEYYKYISAYEEDDAPISGGIFIHNGIPHFVIRKNDLASSESVIAHELTHSAVAHLNIPLWLNEGLAVNTERQVAGRGIDEYEPHIMHKKHVKYWTPNTIQDFWSGKSFRQSGDRMILSYNLAMILTQFICKDWNVFKTYIENISTEDSGYVAAKEYLNIDLGLSIAAIIEKDGDFSPISGK